MKQSTNDQHWYDQLSSVYSIEEFPPLHSFSFTDWHWIGDDDLINDHQRPFKIISTAVSSSSPNDVWTLIMDEERTTEPPLYSSIVQHRPPSSSRHPQQQPQSSPAKVTLLYRKNRKSTDVDAQPMVNDEDESQWSFRLHNQHRRRCRRSSIKPRPMQEEFHREHTITIQDKTRLSNKKKVPPLRQRRVQHRLRSCTHR
ncbi:hypothetical protein [Absidia glauca]|uniref:Uncharacterized protein n=1 Tax=Absidia glauca TaxID=4829 RepID=A0A168N2T0_ABSGL|nr:hypothetical protein [Absidia glauca]